MSDEIFTRLKSLLKAYEEHKASTAPGPRTGGGSDRKRQAGAEALRKVVRPVLDAFMTELKNAGHEASTSDHTEREDAYPSVALSFTPRGGLASAPTPRPRRSSRCGRRGSRPRLWRLSRTC